MCVYVYILIITSRICNIGLSFCVHIHWWIFFKWFYQSFLQVVDNRHINPKVAGAGETTDDHKWYVHQMQVWWRNKCHDHGDDGYPKWKKRMISIQSGWKEKLFKSHVLKMDNKINSPVICVHLCVYTESVWLSARDDEPVSWRMCVHYREYVCVYKVFHTSTVPATLYYNSWSDFTFLKAGFTPQHLWSNATFLKWDFIPLYHSTIS